MTCVVGIVADGQVHLGADSAATGGWGNQDLLVDGKLFRNGDLVFGCSGSPRIAQVLQYVLQPPKHYREIKDDAIVERDVTHFMVSNIIPTIREVLRGEEALAIRNNTVQLDGNSAFLLGYRGHLYTVYSDLQVHENTDRFAATGSGGEIALGALYTNRNHPNVRERLEQALDGACRYNAYCRPPYSFLSV